MVCGKIRNWACQILGTYYSNVAHMSAKVRIKIVTGEMQCIIVQTTSNTKQQKSQQKASKRKQHKTNKEQHANTKQACHTNKSKGRLDMVLLDWILNMNDYDQWGVWNMVLFFNVNFEASFYFPSLEKNLRSCVLIFSLLFDIID